MVGAHRGWRFRIIARIGLRMDRTHARENRSRSQAEPVTVHDGRVVRVFASSRPRIVVVVSGCKYVKFRFRESCCYRELLSSTPIGGLIPRGMLGFPDASLCGGNYSSPGGEFSRPGAPRERPRILDGRAREPGRFPFLWPLSRAGYEGHDAKRVSRGRIDALISRRLRNGNAPGMTDRLEAGALRARDRLGSYGMEAGAARTSLVSHASVCGKHQKAGGREGRWNVGAQIRYVPLQPNICCRIRRRSRLRVTAARVPQC